MGLISNNKKQYYKYWKNIVDSINQVNDLSAMSSYMCNFSQIKVIKDPVEKYDYLDKDLYLQLKSFSQNQGITINAIIQFAWHKLVQIYTQNNQTVVGMTVSGRNIDIKE